MPRFYQNMASLCLRWPVMALLGLQISFALFLEFRSSLFGFILIIVTSSLALIHFQEHKLKRFAIFLLIVLLSSSWFFIQHRPLSSNIFPKKARYQAMLIDSSFKTDRFTKILVDLKKRLAPIADSVSGRVLLTVGTDCPLSKRTEIEFFAKVKPPTSYHNPGVFDYQKYLRRKNIFGKAFVQNCEDIAVIKSSSSNFKERIQDRIFSGLTDSRIKNGSMMSSLLLGTKTMTAEQKNHVRDAGLSHLFAISGTHFGVMSALVFLFISFLTGLFPSLYLKLPRQKIAGAVTLIFVLFYMALIAPQPSVLRAGTMISVFLMAMILERQKNILYIILLSASVILFFQPLAIFHVSFQLSYLCVLILAIVYPHLSRYFEKREKVKKRSRVLSYLLQILLLSWLLNVMLIPLILLEFGSSPVDGFINNLWAVPYFQFVVIPLSLIYLISSILVPSVSFYVLVIWDRSLDWFLSLVDVVSSWSLPVFDSFSPHFIPVLLFYSFILLFFLTKNRKILVALVVVVGISLGFIYYENRLSYDLRITQLDVGQGDAILVQTKNKNILIDTGGHLYFDVGSRVLLPYFRHIWLDRLDLVILTHSDLDHYGGLSSIIESITVKEVWINNLDSDDTTYEQVIAKLGKALVPIKRLNGETKIAIDNKTALHVLAPTREFSNLIDDNNHSIVIKISQGDFNALFAGDLSKDGEKILVSKYGEELNSNYLKVSHHGSNSSSTDAFLDMVQPQLATIGVAKNSRFGHPHQKVLERLKGRKISVYRTDLHGAVEIVVNDGKVNLLEYKE